MQSKKMFLKSILILTASCFVLSGCAVNFYKQNPRNKARIRALESEIDYLKRQRQEEIKQFSEAQKLLEEKLKSQIDDQDVLLQMTDRGLVIILSDEILFDPGTAKVKRQAVPILDKVAKIIKKKLSSKSIGVGGHTDNRPIKYSKWKSNWELSTARATNVLHLLVRKGISPDKLSATGYGKHKSIASNVTEVGRNKNRRVEIIVLPEFAEKRRKLKKRKVKKYVK